MAVAAEMGLVVPSKPNTQQREKTIAPNRFDLTSKDIDTIKEVQQTRNVLKVVAFLINPMNLCKWNKIFIAERVDWTNISPEKYSTTKDIIAITRQMYKTREGALDKLENSLSLLASFNHIKDTVGVVAVGISVFASPALAGATLLFLKFQIGPDLIKLVGMNRDIELYTGRSQIRAKQKAEASAHAATENTTDRTAQQGNVVQLNHATPEVHPRETRNRLDSRQDAVVAPEFQEMSAARETKTREEKLMSAMIQRDLEILADDLEENSVPEFIAKPVLLIARAYRNLTGVARLSIFLITSPAVVIWKTAVWIDKTFFHRQQPLSPLDSPLRRRIQNFIDPFSTLLNEVDRKDYYYLPNDHYLTRQDTIALRGLPKADLVSTNDNWILELARKAEEKNQQTMPTNINVADFLYRLTKVGSTTDLYILLQTLAPEVLGHAIYWIIDLDLFGDLQNEQRIVQKESNRILMSTPLAAEGSRTIILGILDKVESLSRNMSQEEKRQLCDVLLYLERVAKANLREQPEDFVSISGPDDMLKFLFHQYPMKYTAFILTVVSNFLRTGEDWEIQDYTQHVAAQLHNIVGENLETEELNRLVAGTIQPIIALFNKAHPRSSINPPETFYEYYYYSSLEQKDNNFIAEMAKSLRKLAAFVNPPLPASS